MNLEKIGIILKKNTANKSSLIKLAAALVLSNLFFFILLSDSSEVKNQKVSSPDGWVEVQLTAELLTPFQIGKKVLVVHRMGRKKLEGVLQNSEADQGGRLTILVKESEAHTLFEHESWEILPYLKQLRFTLAQKESTYEISY